MEQEAIIRYDEALRRSLNDVGLGWLVDDVDQSINQGIVEIKYLRPRGRGTSRGVLEYQSVAERTPNAEKFTTTRAYNPEERLQALLFAIRDLLVNHPKSAREMLERLRSLPTAHSNHRKVTRETANFARFTQPEVRSISFEADPSAGDVPTETFHVNSLVDLSPDEAITTIDELVEAAFIELRADDDRP